MYKVGLRLSSYLMILFACLDFPEKQSFFLLQTTAECVHLTKLQEDASMLPYYCVGSSH